MIDTKTNAPVEYASVTISKEPSLGTSTDSPGRFRIDNIPVGRYNICTSFMRYRTYIANEIPVTSCGMKLFYR